MAGLRGGLGRVAAMAIALVVLMALLLVESAWAGTYRVAQCGWGAGADAVYGDTTGGAKFRPDAFCAGADLGSAHVKSFTRDAATVSGSQFAHWRWTSPPGTGITAVSGDWWHVLHDGMEDRLGIDTNGDGAFAVQVGVGFTTTEPSGFAFQFPWPQQAFEARLLCARGPEKWCSLEPGSWAGLRALTLTMDDESVPQVGIGGGLLAGWLRGGQEGVFWSSDFGSGLVAAELQIDDLGVARAEFPCAKTLVEGAWEATLMKPCQTEGTLPLPVSTATFSDGPHTARTCAVDFAGNSACTVEHRVLFDNNAPTAPRAVVPAGGEGWRRTNGFDLSWSDPDQGAASPIGGALWRLTGPNGADSGVQYSAGSGIAALAGLKVPGDGAWNLHLWLRDEAGNDAVDNGVDLPLRFDDAQPSVAFADGDPSGGKLVAAVVDPLAGPAAGQISYRRADLQDWTDLATRFHGEEGGKATLTAPLPDLGAGTWIFRAEASDAAGNGATTSLHADGTQMSIKVTPAEAATAKGSDGKDGGRGGDGKGGGRGGDGGDSGPAPRRIKTRLFARLRGGSRRGGDSLTVPFGAPALLSGRLTDAAGAGLSGHAIRVVARPSRGALASRTVEHARTGKRGGFDLRLPPGTSRRISVSFTGSGDLAPSRHRSLDLRVRSGVSLEAAPAALVTGQAVHLSGLVAGRAAPIPRRGKLVAIQYLESDGDRWRPVLVTRTDHDGHFHARYRFRYVSGTARIRMRATALAEERWPYAPGSSKPVTVEVQGR